MPPRKRGAPARPRVGKVSVYRHHGAWWLSYREHGQQVRRKLGQDRGEAEQVAAQVNAQLAQGAPTLVAFTPVAVAELRLRFLDYHEQVLRSSLGTVRGYRAVTKHLEDFAAGRPCPPQALIARSGRGPLGGSSRGGPQIAWVRGRCWTRPPTR